MSIANIAFYLKNNKLTLSVVRFSFTKKLKLKNDCDNTIVSNNMNSIDDDKDGFNIILVTWRSSQKKITHVWTIFCAKF